MLTARAYSKDERGRCHASLALDAVNFLKGIADISGPPLPPMITLVAPTNHAGIVASTTMIAKGSDPNSYITKVSVFANRELVDAASLPTLAPTWVNPPSSYRQRYTTTATDASGFQITLIPVFAPLLWNLQTLVANGGLWRCSDQGLNLSNAWRVDAFNGSDVTTSQTFVIQLSAIRVLTDRLGDHSQTTLNRYATTSSALGPHPACCTALVEPCGR